MIIRKLFNEQCITFSQMNLIYNSRFIWRALSTWTRAYLISRYLGIGTEESLFTRLYNESSKFGDMFRLVFGERFSENFTWLLNEYTIALRDLVSAQKEGNTDGVNQSLERLYKNAAERARLMAQVNPFWDESTWRNIFETYLRFTIEMINSFISGDYSNDAEAYDRLTAFTNNIGDYFAQGIYEFLTYTPTDTENLQGREALNPISSNKISDLRQCITRNQVDAIYSLRMFWFELATWTRYYLISRYKGIGNEDIILARLNKVVEEFGIMLRRIFGDQITEEFLNLIYSHIKLIISLITAQIEGNADIAAEATRLLYQNAEETASFLASINPFWDKTTLRDRLYSYIRSTIDESTTFLTGEYDRNIDIFARILTHAENTGNEFAMGLFNYIISKKLNL
ncbi:MAG: hypothetical protein K0R19_970 [Bacillota bacterium]|nr:hypothetical protein [Bacillota bacterium]